MIYKQAEILIDYLDNERDNKQKIVELFKEFIDCYTGYLYRGIYLNKEDYENFLNSKYLDKQYSFSKNLEIAEKFSKSGDRYREDAYKIILIIKNKKVILIEDIYLYVLRELNKELNINNQINNRAEYLIEILLQSKKDVQTEEEYINVEGTVNVQYISTNLENTIIYCK